MTDREQTRLQIVEDLLKTIGYQKADVLLAEAEVLYRWIMCDHPVSSKTDADRGG